jgi:pimeloyl-ACP methyl ester carboxylesterase
LAPSPVTERRLTRGGISTRVLAGGGGPPVVLLPARGAHAAHWLRVVPGLVATHRVIAPDLPGHGASEVGQGSLDPAGVSAWLGELIQRTCPSPPALVGHLLGGAMAARFAADHGDRLRSLVLVDTFGLDELQLEPELAQALARFLAEPGEATHDALWRHCALDLDALRGRMGELWPPFRAYNVDRVGTPSVQAAFGALMEQLGWPAIPPGDLARITVPTTLVWGRHDRATLPGAQAASARYGWPLQVIDEAADDAPVEQPEAFVRVLRAVLEG